MSNFKDISEFRAALDQLVAGPTPKARKNGRTRRARRNMAVRVPFGGEIIEFDTPQEAAEFLSLMGGGSPAPKAERRTAAPEREQATSETGPANFFSAGARRAAEATKSAVEAAERVTLGGSPFGKRAPSATKDEIFAAFYELPELSPQSGVGKAYRNLHMALGASKEYAPGFYRLVKGGASLPVQNMLRYLGVSEAMLTPILDEIRSEFPGAFELVESRKGNQYYRFDREGEYNRADLKRRAREIVNMALEIEGLPVELPYKGKTPPDLSTVRENPLVNWTAYPQAAYETYYRTNPATEVRQPTDGGPYLPEMFPYGQGGRVYDYEEAQSNPRPPRRSRRNRRK